jgi:alpha-glucosidase (family GH31 glycosyl hydrolase)
LDCLCPEEEDEYHCSTEYLIGDDIIVAPFIMPIDNITGLATIPVWLPQDMWFDVQTNGQYRGGWQIVCGDLSHISIFVRAGGDPIVHIFSERKAV